ncbi:MAG TPA: RIP metalloprotease RseP [Clostridiales bacterium]|nr:RIP metalloprotease RseP [Clostridiales bacterium]
MKILISLAFFSIMIMIHEVGHFLVARSVGIYAEELSIGMGPRLLKIPGKETEYSLRLLPIGGYVRFLGEDEDSDDPRAFNNTKVWKRIAVVVAGPLMNILLAVVLLTVSSFTFGIYDADLPIIEDVISGYPAEKAGLHPGDRILSVGDMDVSRLKDSEAVQKIRSYINENGSDPFRVTFERSGQTKHLNVVPSYDKENNRYQLGFYFKVRTRKPGFFEAIGMSFQQTFQLIGVMLTALKDLIFSGTGINGLTGPVGIVGEIGKAAQAGIQQLLNLGIVITINLGVMNLVPFPALDGGKLLLLVVEGLRGKPMDQNKEGYFNLIGFVLLMILMVVVTYKDIIRF